MIHVTIPGIAVSQPRKWAVPGKKKDGTAYVKTIAAPSAHPINQWRDRIAHEISKALGPDRHDSEFDNAIVGAAFIFPRSGTLLKKKPNPPRPGGRSDLDNLLKPLQDVGNELGIWKDDRRVFHVAGLLKRERSGDNPRDVPRAEFWIWDAREWSLETWVQFCIDVWPIEWSGGIPTR